MSTAIEFNNISKQYRLGLVSTRTLNHDLKRWWAMNIMGKEDPYLKIGDTNDRSTRGDSEYVWALKNIDFKVEEGDVVGIIGKNGAGKSTLLKILSKVTGPTTGTIRARGRIGSLLEVGTGFHAEMTGRENIFLNGAILGMTKSEISKKLDEIVDFSGCERYIDTPVKRYSSGMTVRLGFAVAAFLEPEILVVDEVLAVGDAEFQKKAIGKMQGGVLLENGQVKFMGNISDTIHNYLNDQVVQSEYRNPNPNPKEKINVLWAKVASSLGNIFYSSTPIDVDLCVEVNQPVKDLVVGFNLISSFRHPLARTDYNDLDGRHSLEPGTYVFHFQIPANTLSNGEYTINFDVAEKAVRSYSGDETLLTFEVSVDPTSNINVFSENLPIKTSIIRELWIKGYERV